MKTFETTHSARRAVAQTEELRSPTCQKETAALNGQVSTLDDLLKEDGKLQEFQALAINEVLARQSRKP